MSRAVGLREDRELGRELAIKIASLFPIRQLTQLNYGCLVFNI